jgi:hypothetical protein|nr:MAG TPA_asm: hypothetical protein [Caudoviricetes sp.]
MAAMYNGCTSWNLKLKDRFRSLWCEMHRGLFSYSNVKNELSIKESLCFIWALKEFYVPLHRE